MSQIALQPPPVSLADVQHFVLEDASWELYEKLLRDIGDRPIQVTYDRGKMEIMSPLPEHEDAKKFIGRLIEMLSFELNRPVKCLGSITFRRKDKSKGLGPDECYYFRNEAVHRSAARTGRNDDPAHVREVGAEKRLD